jgi:predicted dehydrogenase
MNLSNRRRFLGAAAALALHRPASAAGEKVRLGLIGCGWYGMVDLNAAFKAGGVEAVALCDADSKHLAEAAAAVEKRQGSPPKTFKHHRELLDQPGLDAVVIATPPQWHALQFIDACRKRLHVYCEKPLAYDIREGRAMVEAARKSGAVVQVGFQRRQSAAFQQAARYIRDGHAGRIVQVDVNIHYTAGTPDPSPQDPPASLDWDLWCGPAPKLPYSPAIAHRSWRLEAAYGNGHLVDWGIHLMDAARVALGETTPKSVTAAGGIYHYKGKITTPDTLTAHFEFEKCPVVWRHRLWGAAEYLPETNNGITFFGENESVFAADNRWVVIPRKGERRVTEARSDAGLLHMQDFLEAVRNRRRPSCTIEDAYDSTTTVQLGMIAYRAGGRVDWDRAREQIPGNPAAAKLLKRDYRAPYRHPA